jgi:hypothetical protein
MVSTKVLKFTLRVHLIWSIQDAIFLQTNLYKFLDSESNAYDERSPQKYAQQSREALAKSALKLPWQEADGLPEVCANALT